jgi:uncharacterized membrane protein YeaQ/YmgE (transglycosylase-associated protein family)
MLPEESCDRRGAMSAAESLKVIKVQFGQPRAVGEWFRAKGGTCMGIISWIILGLIAGFIGSKIVNREGQGFWLDIALGIVGALVGGFLFDAFGATGVTGLNIWSMIVAVVGSIVVLLIYNAAMGRRRA